MIVKKKTLMCHDKVCHEIIDYISKPVQIKLPLFHVFRGLQEFSFLDIYIYVSKATLLIFWLKQIYFE